MKIGILTFHCAHNYGAVLQCYALQEFLKGIGNNVCVVNYRPRYLKENIFSWYKWFSLSPVKMIKKITWQKKTFKYQWKKEKAFNYFVKKYLNVENIDLASPKNDIECFVFGSDQIWRKSRNLFDPIYFGSFKGSNGKKLVSYAASMGVTSLSEEDGCKVANWLTHFDKISVRETSLRDILLQITPEDIKVVVDPTFLLDVNTWERIAKAPKICNQYLLIYQVIFNPATYTVANTIAKDLGLEIVEISSDFTLKKANHCIVYDASPQDFLGWILNADFVVTTSFHGTAFSLIYNRPFVSIKQNLPSDVRIESILSLCGQSDRFIKCNDIKLKPASMGKPNVDFAFVSPSKEFLEGI